VLLLLLRIVLLISSLQHALPFDGIEVLAYQVTKLLECSHHHVGILTGSCRRAAGVTSLPEPP